MKQAPPIRYPAAAQRDGVAESAAMCPTCGREWGNLAIKVCRLCGQPMGRHHRYKMVPVGPGLFALQHYSCTEPTTRGGKKK